jgi:tripartite-type tricarboxylate transporter receptor subunit TctC
MTDLLAEQVDLMVSQAAVVLPNLQAGTIKPLANLSPRRSLAVPEIPSSDESGVPGLYASGWFGFFAPKGTSKDVVAKLNDAMVRALNEPTVRSRFAQLGLDMASPEQQRPEGLATLHKAEIEKWWPIIKSANIKAE